MDVNSQITMYKSCQFMLPHFLCIFTIYVHFVILKSNIKVWLDESVSKLLQNKMQIFDFNQKGVTKGHQEWSLDHDKIQVY